MPSGSVLSEPLCISHHTRRYKMKSVCFTGHRVLSGDINNLGIRLYDILEREILNAGITQYYGGGAVEWDTLCAQTVLKLRDVMIQ